MNMSNTKKTANNSINKMSSVKKSESGRIVLFRTLIIILADIIIGSLFDFVKSDANRELYFHFNIYPVLMYVFGALFALSVVYFVVTLVKKTDISSYIITPMMTAGLCFFLFVSVMFYDKFRITPFLFYTLMVVGSVLYVVYYIYTKLFYKK